MVIIVVVALFFAFNVWSGTRGLVRANMGVYFRAKRNGASQSEALGMVIKTRFPNSLEKQSRLMGVVNSQKPEADCLKSLVYTIFVEEHGAPTYEWNKKITKMINEEYVRLVDS